MAKQSTAAPQGTRVHTPIPTGTKIPLAQFIGQVNPAVVPLGAPGGPVVVIR